MERIFNTGEKQSELNALYNPEGSLKRIVQLRLLDMLLYLDKVCKELNIDYSLEFGNVLGAIRHGGFIPWDDDVDVSIPWKDYDKLTTYLINNPHPQYVIQCPETDSMRLTGWNTLRDTHSLYKYRKVNLMDQSFKYRGLQIDLFCYAPWRVKWLYRLIGGMHTHICLVNMGKRNWIAKCYFKIEKYLFIPFANAYSILFGNKKYVQHRYGCWLADSFPKELLYPHKPILFEGHYFSGPADPEGYCSYLYKNYMDLPSKDRRESHPVDYEIW